MVHRRISEANHTPKKIKGETGCQSTWFRDSWGISGLGELVSRRRSLDPGLLAYRAGNWREIEHRTEKNRLTLRTEGPTQFKGRRPKTRRSEPVDNKEVHLQLELKS